MNKITACVAAIATLIGTPALAADHVYNWTGFYAGLNAGWSWGKQDTTVNFPGPAFSGGNVAVLLVPIAYQETTHPNGAIGGVQIGYNWQTMSNWIFGVEADFQASGEGASGNNHQNQFEFIRTNGSSVATFNISQSISQNGSLLWFGTVRGRIGYAIWPTVMLYTTGGLAYGRLNESASGSFNSSCTGNDILCTLSFTFVNGSTLAVPFSINQSFEAAVTKTGWTVGGGIEGAVPNTHVTWKAEYLYMDLGTANYTFSDPFLGTILVSTHFADNIVRVGLNYQFH